MGRLITRQVKAKRLLTELLMLRDGVTENEAVDRIRITERLVNERCKQGLPYSDLIRSRLGLMSCYNWIFESTNRKGGVTLEGIKLEVSLNKLKKKGERKNA